MSATQTTTQTKRPAGAKLSAKRERVDATLREALSMHADSRGRWEKLTSAGATDEEIWRALKHEFGEGGSAQTEGGIQFAYADGAGFSSPPKFWINCGTHYTQAKPTLQGAALVARVRKVLSIPQLAPPDAAAGDGVADSDAGGDEASGAHEFCGDGTLCSLCFQGRRGKSHRTWKKPQAGGDAALARSVEDEQAAQELRFAGGDDDSHAAPDEALLAQTESEQRARFSALRALHSRKRQSKKSREEISRLSEEYDATYSSIADAFGPGASLDMRARVEDDGSANAADGDAPGDTAIDGERRRQLDAACGDCNHTQEVHDAFDAGLLAGERGYDADGCPHDGGDLREAWFVGFDVGNGNRSATLAAESGVVEDTPVIDAAPAEPRVFTKEVEITLNDHDIAQIARKASLLALQIEELEAEKKETADSYKARIGGLEEERDKLMRVIRQGRETREEDVFERRDYDRKVVEVVRADDFAIVETRPMRPTEYQLPLVSL